MESDFRNLILVEISQQRSGGLPGEEGACLFLIDDIVLGITYITLFIFFFWWGCFTITLHFRVVCLREQLLMTPYFLCLYYRLHGNAERDTRVSYGHPFPPHGSPAEPGLGLALQVLLVI